MRTTTHEDWIKEGEVLFGKDFKEWLWVCPQCKTKQGIHDFREAGVSDETIEGAIAFSCIGRFTNDKGCDWTLSGLLHIHQLEVVMPSGKNRMTFEFYKK